MQKWIQAHQTDPILKPPVDFDDVHTQENLPELIVTSPVSNDTIRGSKLSVSVVASSKRGVKIIGFFLDNNRLFEASASGTYSLDFPPGTGSGFHVLRVEASDDVGNKQSVERNFNYIP